MRWANSPVSGKLWSFSSGEFVCLQTWTVPELCGSKFCPYLLVGREGLIPKMVILEMPWYFSPLVPPPTCGVSFYYIDGIMSLGISFQWIFPPSWIDLVLANSCWLLSPPQWFPAINCLLLITHGSGGSGERPYQLIRLAVSVPTSSFHLLGASPNLFLSCLT